VVNPANYWKKLEIASDTYILGELPPPGGYFICLPRVLLGNFGMPRVIPKFPKRGQSESAGMNRHRVGNERVPRERSSCTITRPRVMRG